MDYVRDTASAVRQIFGPPPQEAYQPTIPSDFEPSTPTQDSSQHEQESPQYPGSSSDTNELANMPASALTRKLKRSQRTARLKTRDLKSLKRKHQKTLLDHERLRRENEEMLQRRQELVRDHQQLRREYQDLRHDHQELRQQHREPQRERRELYREHQKLIQEHQELQCIHDELEQDLDIVKSENRKLSADLKRECFESNRDKERMEVDITHWETSSQAIETDALRANALQRQVDKFPTQLQESQVDVKVLQQQVQDLLKEMLARVEKVQAVSDEQFAQAFRTLSAHIKSLSRSVRLNLDANMFQILDSGVLLANTNTRHWKIRAHQKYYIEAWIWSVLLQLVFDTPFSVFGKAGASLGQNWKVLFGQRHDGGLSRPSDSSESYRYAVVSQCVRLAGRDTITEGQAEAHNPNRRAAHHLATGTLERRDEVANTIGTKLATISSTVDVSQISNIINRAFALALEMSLQKCRLQITYSDIGATFHSGSMSSMPGLDGDDMNDGVVAFIVNPGLTKWGDAHGKMLDQHYAIVPSLVQLEAVMVKRQCI
ncbi:hypothetical protein SLS59_004026 [Nothophoma quercina]|uniref:Uncharacterized protein n=1 Tax=Nothophoma quercina TaxID=749835 RepID=A0ABR3RIN2_9PLEO